jgi:hypothetical protein
MEGYDIGMKRQGLVNGNLRRCQLKENTGEEQNLPLTFEWQGRPGLGLPWKDI